MATYNLYSYNNGEENTEPSIIVELNEDDTEIVSVTSADPEQQEEDERSIRHYVELGATPLGAMKHYIGSYGQVWNADGTGEVPEEVADTTDPEDVVDDESVVSAADDATPAEEDVSPSEDTSAAVVPGPASQILSGASMAMVGDDGIVVTMFRADEEGNFFIRADGDWQSLVDPDVLSDLAFVGVQEEALALYDERVADGKLAPIKYYPVSAEGPYWTDTVDDVAEEAPEETSEEVPEEDPETVTASIVLNSAGDLEIAIAAAMLNQDLRWFVERRVAALGLETELPWRKD